MQYFEAPQAATLPSGCITVEETRFQCRSLTDQVKISRTQGAHQGQHFARQEPQPALAPNSFTHPNQPHLLALVGC